MNKDANASPPDRIDPTRLDLHRIVETAGGGSCFVYDVDAIQARVARLRHALPAGLALRYAVKANPFPPLLHHVAGLVDGLDVASGREMQIGLNATRDATALAFAGPGKTDAELDAAIAGGVLLEAESPGEVSRIQQRARDQGRRARLALRLNPGVSASGAGLRMAGATQFGMAPDDAVAVLDALEPHAIAYEGVHAFLGSQVLDAGVITQGFETVVALVRDVTARSGRPPAYVNLGGGFGIPYARTDRPLDLDAVGRGLADTLAGARSALPPTRFGIELGRYLVGEAGIYVTRVVDRKTNGGETFVVTEGGLHHVLAATGNFGQRIRRNWPVSLVPRGAPGPIERQTVVGCNCTPLDTLASGVELPRAEPGDLVVVAQTGAYGATASPAGFLSHPEASEVLV